MPELHPLDLLIRKLEANGPLAQDDRSAILALPVVMKTVPANTYLMHEGEPPITCAVLVSGYAFRQKLASNGARQIVSIHIPGEAMDFQSIHLGRVDHSAQSMTRAGIALVPINALRELTAARVAIANAVVFTLLVEASISREWILNNGRRSARDRLAHLLCEFALRLDAQGLSDGQDYELPMTQEQIGDALGLTSIHVNRSLKALEAEGLIRRKGRAVSFPDLKRLRSVADFNSLYLHERPIPISA